MPGSQARTSPTSSPTPYLPRESRNSAQLGTKYVLMPSHLKMGGWDPDKLVPWDTAQQEPFLLQLNLAVTLHPEALETTPTPYQGTTMWNTLPACSESRHVSPAGGSMHVALFLGRTLSTHIAVTSKSSEHLGNFTVSSIRLVYWELSLLYRVLSYWRW